jgi:hypothetical protein
LGAVEELGAFIDSESTRFTVGTNLFYHLMPSEPNAATSIVEYPGEGATETFGGDLPKYESARVAITCRSTSSTAARANAHAAWVAAFKIANETLSGKSWLKCTPLQSPFFLKRDEQNRPLFQFNAACVRRTTST